MLMWSYFWVVTEGRQLMQVEERKVMSMIALTASSNEPPALVSPTGQSGDSNQLQWMSTISITIKTLKMLLRKMQARSISVLVKFFISWADRRCWDLEYQGSMTFLPGDCQVLIPTRTKWIWLWREVWWFSQLTYQIQTMTSSSLSSLMPGKNFLKIKTWLWYDMWARTF